MLSNLSSTGSSFLNLMAMSWSTTYGWHVSDDGNTNISPVSIESAPKIWKYISEICWDIAQFRYYVSH